MKILITGGKSAVALKILKAFTQHQVILADYGEMPNFLTETYKFISLGEKNEDSIAHVVLNNCLDEEVDLIVPIHTFEIMPISKAKVLFDEFNIDVLLPEMDDLSYYFASQNDLKSKDWIVINKGQVLFSSLPDEDLLTIDQNVNLSGVFYYNRNELVANLNLITI